MDGKIRKRFLFLLGALLWGSGCDSQDLQDAFAERASLPPSGFTAVEQCGTEPSSEDPDDWRTAPRYRGRIRVDPACPNPAPGERVTVSITVYEGVRGGLALRVYDNSRPRRLIRIPDPGADDLIAARDAGLYSFSFESVLLPQRGLQRLFIFDGTGELVSYGDLLVE